MNFMVIVYAVCAGQEYPLSVLLWTIVFVFERSIWCRNENPTNHTVLNLKANAPNCKYYKKIISNETGEMESAVEAVCWDISLGVAGTGFGRWLLGRTCSSKEMKPTAIDHVGLKIYDYLYEYGDQGILRTKIVDNSEPKSKYPAYALRSVEEIGTTSVVHDGFEGWIADQNEGQFRASNYNVVTNSCIVWAIAACAFLGVPHPPNWDKIIDWAKANNKVAQLVGRSGMSSRVASTAIVKPQSD